MTDTLRLPYGISDFGRLRRQGYHYVDKTPFLHALENERRGRSFVVFLRPRRTGKSLFLSMLEPEVACARTAVCLDKAERSDPAARDGRTVNPYFGTAARAPQRCSLLMLVTP